jgi:hypothetical protein
MTPADPDPLYTWPTWAIVLLIVLLLAALHGVIYDRPTGAAIACLCAAGLTVAMRADAR